MKAPPNSFTSTSPAIEIERLKMDGTHTQITDSSPLMDASMMNSSANRLRMDDIESEMNRRSGRGGCTKNSRKNAVDRLLNGSMSRQNNETRETPLPKSRSASPRRLLPRRELSSFNLLQARELDADKNPAIRNRRSKSMTNLSFDTPNNTTKDPKARRSVPRREDMPVEVLALLTMDLHHEEKHKLSSRLSRSMTDLLASPNAIAIDTPPESATSRRARALPESDSSRQMPSLPIRDHSTFTSKYQNAAFQQAAPQHDSPEKRYLDKLIMKSALSVKSPWHLKQILNVTQQNASELQENEQTAIRTEPNMFFDTSCYHFRTRGSDSTTTTRASDRTGSSRSMTDLRSTPSSLLVDGGILSELSRSHSSERMPTMPTRRGSINNTTGKVENTIRSVASSSSKVQTSAEKRYNMDKGVMTSARSVQSPWHAKQTHPISPDIQERAAIRKPRTEPNMFFDTTRAKSEAGSLTTVHVPSASETTHLSLVHLSKSMTDLPGSSGPLLFDTNTLSELRRSQSSERMPTIPKRRGSIIT